MNQAEKMNAVFNFLLISELDVSEIRFVDGSAIKITEDDSDIEWKVVNNHVECS